MRKLSLFLIILFLNGITLNQAAGAEFDDITSDNDTYSVCVTKSGSKYHRSNCSTIKNSKNLSYMTKKQAVSKGYTACGVCKP